MTIEPEDIRASRVFDGAEDDADDDADAKAIETERGGARTGIPADQVAGGGGGREDAEKEPLDSPLFGSRGLFRDRD